MHWLEPGTSCRCLPPAATGGGDPKLLARSARRRPASAHLGSALLLGAARLR